MINKLYMDKFIILTTILDNKILIPINNIDNIVSVNEQCSKLFLKTNIKQNFLIKESIDEIFNMINS